MRAFVPANVLRLRRQLLRRCARASARRADAWNTPARPVRRPRRRPHTFHHLMPGAGDRGAVRRAAVSAPVMERPGDWIETLRHRQIIGRSKSESPAGFKYLET